MSPTIAAGADGLYRPRSEAEIIDLVKLASREGRQLRVRGAAHSVSQAIYADSTEPYENQVGRRKPPPTRGINIALDRYRGWRVIDEDEKLVEAEAGIHFGPDPSDPTAPLKTSLLWQLAETRGWALDQTGGITHQTVSGFTATGSSGGSVRFSMNDNLWGFRLIDGSGEVHDLTREDPRFFAMAPSLGLLGVVSKVILRCVDNFAIAGQQSTTTLAECSVDVLGPGSAQRPSLEQFLAQAEYARLEWWPQRGAERVVRWQAERLRPDPGFQPRPHLRFGAHPMAKQHVVAWLYTIFGNLDDLPRANTRLEDDFQLLESTLRERAGRLRLGSCGPTLARLATEAIRGVSSAVIAGLGLLGPRPARLLPVVFPWLLEQFVPLDNPMDSPGTFSDWAWHGLPMDNEANEVLLPTAFTEVWLPLTVTREAMDALNSYFCAAPNLSEAYRRTGAYAWELYAAKPSEFWLSPSYTSGSDPWQGGAFRIDPYWFAENAADPSTTFCPGVWDLLRDAGLPFRLHWAKYQPVSGPDDRDWLDLLSSHYPKWDAFLALRAKLDPNNIFLTGYWRDRFGLWDAPPPRPQPAADR